MILSSACHLWQPDRQLSAAQQRRCYTTRRGTIYLIDGEVRRQWLAAGTLEPHEGAPLTLVWRNDELSDPPGQRPPGFDEEHRMESRVIACEPPHYLVIAWGEGDVSFRLHPAGEDAVLLTLVHRRLPAGPNRVKIGAGWHAHLDVLAARVSGGKPAPFWDHWLRLRDEYDERFGGSTGGSA